MGFSHVHCPNGLNTTLLSQGCVLGTAPIVGAVGGVVGIPRIREEVRGLDCLGPALGSRGSHVLSMTSPIRGVPRVPLGHAAQEGGARLLFPSPCPWSTPCFLPKADQSLADC